MNNYNVFETRCLKDHGGQTLSKPVELLRVPGTSWIWSLQTGEN